MGPETLSRGIRCAISSSTAHVPKLAKEYHPANPTISSNKSLDRHRVGQKVAASVKDGLGCLVKRQLEVYCPDETPLEVP